MLSKTHGMKLECSVDFIARKPVRNIYEMESVQVQLTKKIIKTYIMHLKSYQCINQDFIGGKPLHEAIFSTPACSSSG